MKINPKEHKPTWRIQKGSKVEWFLNARKGFGVVKKILSSDGPWNTPNEVQILDEETNTEININVDKLRILKNRK